MIFGFDYSAFFEKNLIAIFFIYGFSFFYLFLSIFLSLRSLRTIGLSTAFSYLMLFALSHGIVEWMDMYLQYMRVVYEQQPSINFLYIRLALLVSSFVFMLAFGLRLNQDIGQISAKTCKLLAGLALILFTLLLLVYFRTRVAELRELDVISRSFLCFPGSVIAGIGLVKLSRNHYKETLPIGHSRHFRWCGYTLVAYGVLAGLVGPKASFLWSPYINTESFFAFTGTPIQLFRTITALFVSYFLIRAMALRISQRLVGVFGAFFVVFFILAFTGHTSIKLIGKSYEKTLSLSSEQSDYACLLRDFDWLDNISRNPDLSADKHAHRVVIDEYLKKLSFTVGQVRSKHHDGTLDVNNEETWEMSALDKVAFILDRETGRKGDLNASSLKEASALLHGLVDLHQTRIDMSREKVAQELIHFKILRIVLFLLSAAAFSFIGYSFYITLIRPLHLLRAGATQIAKGNLGHKINLGTADELQDLSGAFNRMADRLLDRTGKLRREAITDGLTGLFNHKHFHSRLEFEINRAIRSHSSLSILLIDADNFKQYNDRYGHPAGDDVLRKCSVAICDSIRSMDIAARYGGEEFAIILTETDKNGAMVVAENIRSTIEEYKFREEDDGPTHNVTVSIGVSSYPADSKKMNDLIKMADDALYRAKREGKNKVCVHGT